MNFLRFIRLPKVSSKVWIRLKEFNTWFDVAIWICSVQEQKVMFIVLRDRIVKRFIKMNPSRAFIYLKEALRLTIRALSGSPEINQLTHPRVGRDYTGLPTIIPMGLRLILRTFIRKEGDYLRLVNVIVCTLSCLSIFRVFKTAVVPKLGTIIAPFSGSVRSLDLSLLTKAVFEITSVRLKLNIPKFLILTTASPNGPSSTWFAGLDALAFLYDFRIFLTYVRYSLSYGSLVHLLWLILLMIVGGALLLFARVFSGKWFGPFHLGKLGTVFDQAGKARIVGITNFWIQCLLKPLHSAIFSLLRRLPTDGTFDQEAPIKRLISLVGTSGQKFHSFDLSAATDRIPVDVQADILNIWGRSNLGDLWRKLLSFSFYYKGEYIKYAVGQPMGAYSSWGMLALTHHILVRASALRVGIMNFDMYAVLGDDIVIAHDLVAQSYLELMSALGVSINLAKSLVSFEFLEFAKRWVGPAYNITPIGPGLILRTVRSPYYISALIAAAFKNELYKTLEQALTLIQTLPLRFKGQCWNSLWAAFGLNSFMGRLSQVESPFGLLSWCFSASGMSESFFRYALFNSLLEIYLMDIRKASSQIDVVSLKLLYRLFHTTFKLWPIKMLDFLLRILGPCYWIYLADLTQSKIDSGLALGAVSKDGSWTCIRDLVQKNTAINIVDVDWRSRSQVKESIFVAKRIVNLFDQTKSDLYQEPGSEDFY